MKPHPDYADLDVPQRLDLGDFRLAILTGEDLEEDYAAVMSSSAVLQGLFGPDWPIGLTRAEDETDLHWHHREFTTKRSFAWVIRDSDQTYIGCAYLNPDLAVCGAGEAAFWMIDTPDRLERLDRFGPLFLKWLSSVLPPDYKLKSRSNR